MTDGRRDRLRRGLSRLLHEVRDRLAPAEEPPPAVAEGVVAPVGPDRERVGVGAAELEIEDVVLEAGQVVAQASVGWEFTLIDLRDASTRAVTGAVAGAVALGPDELTARVHALDPGTTWVLVGEDTARPAEVALGLRRAGHADVFALEGGFVAWRRAGGPVAAEG